MSLGSSAGPPGTSTSGEAVATSERLFRFIRLGHILSSILREILEERFLREVSPHPLTRAQFCFLKLIALNAGLQVGEVARCLGVSPAASTKNVDRLEQYGLVHRGTSPGDRRATLLSPSRDGRRLVRDYEALKTAHFSPVIEGLGEEEADRLCDLLERVCLELVPKETAPAAPCLRCAGYYQADCSVGRMTERCALERSRREQSGCGPNVPRGGVS
jgi:DNA-binding MarR family transcriptional regulator